jgi:hypothetical protein
MATSRTRNWGGPRNWDTIFRVLPLGQDAVGPAEFCRRFTPMNADPQKIDFKSACIGVNLRQALI